MFRCQFLLQGSDHPDLLRAALGLGPPIDAPELSLHDLHPGLETSQRPQGDEDRGGQRARDPGDNLTHLGRPPRQHGHNSCLASDNWRIPHRTHLLQSLLRHLTHPLGNLKATLVAT